MVQQSRRQIFGVPREWSTIILVFKTDQKHGMWVPVVSVRLWNKCEVWRVHGDEGTQSLHNNIHIILNFYFILHLLTPNTSLMSLYQSVSCIMSPTCVCVHHRVPESHIRVPEYTIIYMKLHKQTRPSNPIYIKPALDRFSSNMTLLHVSKTTFTLSLSVAQVMCAVIWWSGELFCALNFSSK